MNDSKMTLVLMMALAFLIAGITTTKRLIQVDTVNFHYVKNLDGNKILSSVDQLHTPKSRLSFFKIKPKFIMGIGEQSQPVITETPINIYTTHQQLAPLWNSTAMVFGAAADGVGIGTTFAIKKTADGKMLFLTNLHVVEQFCDIPENMTSDLVVDGSFKYSCQSLFILHDVVIDTKTNSASVDGPRPWKSEVISLDYFDKQRDLVAFRIDLPEDNNIAVTTLETNYDLKTLLVETQNAEKINPKVGNNMSAITNLNLYLPAYSVPKGENTLIKKQWFKGATEGARTFENDKKLGFISALKHNIEVLPGTSGGPIALSDGRVVGVNSSAEIKQFYAQAGHLWWKQQVLETYTSYFAMPTTYVKNLLENLN